ncbi:hypothetical protein HB2014_120 [Salmonella phage vB_SPuM_SP116]|uniref:Uncharacterized protein n=1 Tax=Salmonella phage vB_SPuM_SP116 TaxID=1567025 RepID=A0A0D4DB08_9CAUD|nr:hypothetical protein HB2014_120 [Salmonella phage vB_SPuM_SP116]AJT60694.1 hypothetical protein HB2014_120 [Salmonella phage vB_SPuM_SP116]UKH49319.1 hypothetical protein [Escherichia phage vB_EcoM_DE7]
MIISFNSALLGTYKVKTELLDEWKKYTNSLFGNVGMEALAEIEKAGTFEVVGKGHFTMFYRTNLNVGDSIVGVTEEELKTFCEKIERDTKWESGTVLNQK